MAKYLYGASVQDIQDFIFKTNELKSIVGASELVKAIATKVDKTYAQQIMINAAGNIRLVFEETQKEQLEILVLNFPKEVQQGAFGITLSQAVVSFEAGGLKDAIELLEKRLIAQRNKNQIPADMSINILNLAPKTAHPLVEKEKDMATLQKEQVNTSRGDIPKNRKNKTAIIHADGNGLGVMIVSMTEHLHEDTAIINAYKSFSLSLQAATQAAFDQAKSAVEDATVRDVILGGDDMTIICDANHALPFTQKFLEAFEKETAKQFKSDALTACAGIAYCNHKYPFHYAVNLAESLCHYAKEVSRDASSVMFHNIQSSNFSTFEEYIEKELTLNRGDDEVLLTYGPYFIHPKPGYSTLQSFIHLASALQIKGSPASRLREWLTLLGQNAVAAKERLLRINTMMELKNTLYNKKVLEKNLNKFNEAITLDNLLFKRQGNTYTPMGDIDTHLSVTDWSEV